MRGCLVSVCVPWCARDRAGENSGELARQAAARMHELETADEATYDARMEEAAAFRAGTARAHPKQALRRLQLLTRDQQDALRVWDRQNGGNYLMPWRERCERGGN